MCFQLLACLSLVLSPKCTSRQCRIERSHPKHRGPETQKLASLQASSPDIRQTEIHRPRPVCASFHGHEKLKGAPPNGPMADQAGNKLVPRFHHNLYERITRLWLFSAFPSNQTEWCFNRSVRFQIRADSGAGAQTETQTKKIPHTRLPISLRTLPPLAARDGVWCASC